jgi:hypothetical protein
MPDGHIYEINLHVSMDNDWNWKNLLGFVTWNVCGICHEKDQLEYKLIKKNIHTAVVSETMTKQNYTKN